MGAVCATDDEEEWVGVGVGVAGVDDVPFMLLLPVLQPPSVSVSRMFDAAFLRSAMSSGEIVWGEVIAVAAAEDDGVAAVIAVASSSIATGAAGEATGTGG